jgi:hypothetical protein
LKFAQFYCILTGVYWLSVPFGCLVFLVFPWAYAIFQTPLLGQAQTDSAMLLPFLNHPAKHRIRLELLMTFGFQIMLFVMLDLSFWPTFACFWIFGMYWGSLQYADHAWSPREPIYEIGFSELPLSSGSSYAPAAAVAVPAEICRSCEASARFS